MSVPLCVVSVSTSYDMLICVGNPFKIINSSYLCVKIQIMHRPIGRWRYSPLSFTAAF